MKPRHDGEGRLCVAYMYNIYVMLQRDTRMAAAFPAFVFTLRILLNLMMKL